MISLVMRSGILLTFDIYIYIYIYIHIYVVLGDISYLGVLSPTLSKLSWKLLTFLISTLLIKFH